MRVIGVLVLTVSLAVSAMGGDGADASGAESTKPADSDDALGLTEFFYEGTNLLDCVYALDRLRELAHQNVYSSLAAGS